MSMFLPEVEKHGCISCEGCPFGGPRVNARGPIDASVVIIGEGPGVQELRQGIPFTGPSGELLARSLPEDVDFNSILMLNAVQCATPQGNAKIQAANKTRFAKALSACKGHVIQMLDMHPRKVIITLGGPAAQSVLNDPNFKVTQERGVFRDVQLPSGQEVRVMPAVHPAFLLRGGGSFKVFQEDVQRGLSHGMGTLKDEYVEPTFEWAEDYETVTRALADLEQSEFNSADFETAGLDPYTGDEILCLGMGRADRGDMATPHTWIFSEEVLLGDRRVAAYLERKDIKFIWHNGKFDSKYGRVRAGLFIRVDHDTLLLSYALDESSGGHDLESLSVRHVGAPKYKHNVKQWLTGKGTSYRVLPKEVLTDRVSKDVANTTAIFWKQYDKVCADKWLNSLYHTTLIPTTNFLVGVEMNGICIDPKLVEENRQLMEIELKAADENFHTIAGCSPINLNSWQQVSYVLYDLLKIKTANGQRPKGTDAKILAKLVHYPAVKALLAYRKIAKALSTYVANLPELVRQDGRIHTTFTQHITTTGRLSSKEPNIQNIPRDPKIRRMYCAAPGMEFIEADLNTAELRILAIVSNDEFLTEIFMDGKRNLHDEVSISMYGEAFTEDQRIRAKAINFGIPYGREAFSIAQEFDIPTREGQRLIDAWFARAPQAATYLKFAKGCPQAGRTLITVFGRKRRPGVVSPERLHELQNEFCNFMMQSTVNDLCMHAGIRIAPRIAVYNARIVNLVHDSILVECPPEHRVAVASIMKYEMERVQDGWLTTKIRMIADLKVGTHWGSLPKKQKQPEGYKLMENYVIPEAEYRQRIEEFEAA